MNKDQIQAAINLAALISQNDNTRPPFSVSIGCYDLAKMAGNLHKRYENACNYEWASGEKYDRATERLEQKAFKLAEKLGVKLELQTDPRGWPFIVTVWENTIRLG